MSVGSKPPARTSGKDKSVTISGDRVEVHGKVLGLMDSIPVSEVRAALVRILAGVT